MLAVIGLQKKRFFCSVENERKSHQKHGTANQIRQGKFFEIEIDEIDEEKAGKKINEMCEKLLVNLIIENYKINKL